MISLPPGGVVRSRCWFTGLSLTTAKCQASGKRVGMVYGYSVDHLVSRSSPLYPYIDHKNSRNKVAVFWRINNSMSAMPVVMKLALRDAFQTAQIPDDPHKVHKFVKQIFAEVRGRFEFVGDGTDLDVGWYLWDMHVIQTRLPQIVLKDEPFIYRYSGRKRLLYEAIQGLRESA